MTRQEWVQSTARRFAGGDSPRRTAELLLCHVLDLDPLSLIRSPALEIEPELVRQLDSMAERWLSHEPLAYLLGWKEFYGLCFQVDAGTLIPRPESEHLIEEALARLPERTIRFADLGTGSGCLAVTLAKLRPHWRGLALDASAAAVQTAQKNARLHQVDSALTFMVADFSNPDSWSKDFGALDLVISNPPYISQAEYESLDPHVRDYEPKDALLAGEGGLQYLNAVIETAGRAIGQAGLLLLEHGSTQARATREMCLSEYWQSVQTGQDLAGLDRYLIAVHR